MVELNLPTTWGKKFSIAIRAINEALESLVSNGGGGGLTLSAPLTDTVKFTISEADQSVTALVEPGGDGVILDTDGVITVVGSGLYRIGFRLYDNGIGSATPPDNDYDVPALLLIGGHLTVWSPSPNSDTEFTNRTVVAVMSAGDEVSIDMAGWTVADADASYGFTVTQLLS